MRKRIAVLFGKTNLPRYPSFYWYPGQWRGHVREYVKQDLKLLAEYLNLQVLELRSCDHMLEAIPPTVRPFYEAVTDVIRGWKDSWLLVAKKKPNWIPQKNLPPEDLAKILGGITGYSYRRKTATTVWQAVDQPSPTDQS